MSHAYGRIRSEDGELLGHFEYSGTSDVIHTKIRESKEEVSKNWRGDDNYAHCKCKGQEVLLAVDYGSGSTWRGKACFEHMAIIGGLERGYECEPWHMGCSKFDCGKKYHPRPQLPGE